jgi:hypothetical protein
LAKTKTKEPSAVEPRLGAWVIRPRPDDELGLFDFSLRDPGWNPPDQEKLTVRVSTMLMEVLESDLDDERKAYYVAHARRILTTGCVQQGPRTEAAAQQLSALEAQFATRDLAQQLANETNRRAWCALYLFFFAAGLGLVLRRFGNILTGVNSTTLCGVAFVWAGCMAAELVSDISIPNVQTVAEYRRLISLLTNPLLRLLGSALTTEALVAAAQNGAITLKVGTLDLTQAWTNVGTSFFLGFAIGLFGTDAAKIIIGRLRGTLRGDESSPRKR